MKIIDIIMDLKKRLLLIIFSRAEFMILRTLCSPSWISNMARHRLLDLTSSPMKSKHAMFSSSVRYLNWSVLWVWLLLSPNRILLTKIWASNFIKNSYITGLQSLIMLSIFLTRLMRSSKSSLSSSLRIIKCIGPIDDKFRASFLNAYLSWPKFMLSKLWLRCLNLSD